MPQGPQCASRREARCHRRQIDDGRGGRHRMQAAPQPGRPVHRERQLPGQTGQHQRPGKARCIGVDRNADLQTGHRNQRDEAACHQILQLQTQCIPSPQHLGHEHQQQQCPHRTRQRQNGLTGPGRRMAHLRPMAPGQPQRHGTQRHRKVAGRYGKRPHGRCSR